MSISLLQIDGGLVTPKDDALLYDWLLQSSGIFTGCTVTSLGANQLQVAAGRGVIKGHVFVIEQQTILAALAPSGTMNGRILVHVDISNTTTPISFVTQAAATLPALTQEDINNGGAVYELPLATYTVSTTAITGLTSASIAASIPAKAADLLAHTSNLSTHITQLSCNKSGTVFALTGALSASGLIPCLFMAPTNGAYVEGDTFTVNGAPYSIVTQNGTAMKSNAFIRWAVVYVVLDVAAKNINIKVDAPRTWYTTTQSVTYGGIQHTLNTPTGFVFSEGCKITFLAGGDLVEDHNSLIVIGGVGYALRTLTKEAVPAYAWKSGGIVTITLSSEVIEISAGSGDGRSGTAFINVPRNVVHAASADYASGSTTLNSNPVKIQSSAPSDGTALWAY